MTKTNKRRRVFDRLKRLVRSLVGTDEIIRQQQEIITDLDAFKRCVTYGYKPGQHALRTTDKNG